MGVGEIKGGGMRRKLRNGRDGAGKVQDGMAFAILSPEQRSWRQTQGSRVIRQTNVSSKPLAVSALYANLG